jgi:ABC-type nitrate/sulfonate/bicarbonate transport system ATPase subunit
MRTFGRVESSPSHGATDTQHYFGHHQAQCGEIFIFGTASEELSDWCAISYMFQDDRLLPWQLLDVTVSIQRKEHAAILIVWSYSVRRAMTAKGFDSDGPAR